MMGSAAVRFVTKIIVGLGLALYPLAAQPTPLAGAPRLIQTLDRLNVLGSLLMVGAHPDDENTAVIAYFARGRHVRTAYLSSTRGEGGQNLIGAEQYEALGLIRTQELLAARRIDGGEQFFTRAFDFGFSKNPEEAFEKWGRQRLLEDMVRVIRRFRPDVIVARFPPQGSAGHGQHTATGHLTPEAFEAAADAERFPEQIRQGLAPWRARRLVFNTFAFGRRQEDDQARAGGRMVIDAGEYDFPLGKSYAEIAAESRSQHSSQGFGSAERKGPSRQSFVHLAGESAKAELFEGIDTTWGRLPGGARAGELLAGARRELDPARPDKSLPLLVEAYRELEPLRDPWVDLKRAELLEAISLAAGLWLDAEADRWNVVPGSSVQVTLTALNRSRFPLSWQQVEVSGVAVNAVTASRPLEHNAPETVRLNVEIPASTPYSQASWMRQRREGDSYPVSDPALIGVAQDPPPLEITFRLRTADGLELSYGVPVRYRWVDRAKGEQVREVLIVPPVAVAFAAPSVIFPDPKPRPVVVRVTSGAGQAKGSVALELPAGWRASPAAAPFDLAARDQQASVAFEVTPPAGAGGGYATVRAEVGGAVVSLGLTSIRHPHIPPQVLMAPARARFERFDAHLAARNIGYVMGAGDDVPQALEQLGASVRLLSAEDLAGADLGRFDAIVTGVRALNVRDDLLAARQRLLDYVAGGGTLVVQYNTLEGFGPGAAPAAGSRAAQLAPYPLALSNNRVSVEEAPVSFPDPDHPLLKRPNRITARDFDGWVQERGLYFLGKWDERYQPVLVSNDPGEPPQAGGTLFARYGKGVYIYTAYAWFRQLPAGVPGAFRVFANLVSAGRD